MSKSVPDSPEIAEPPPPEYWYRYIGEMPVDTYTFGLRWQPGQVQLTNSPIANGAFIAVEAHAPDMAPDAVLPPPPEELPVIAEAPVAEAPDHEDSLPAEPPEPFSVPVTDPST